MKMPKSNKPRGAVKMDTSSGSPVRRDTANPQRAPVNQAQGPRSGNQGTPSKQRAFLDEKSDRSSYFQGLADMVMDRLAMRGEVHKSYISPALEPISPHTRVKRGPTKGNK